MEIPKYPNVFSLGNFARQVTFASQQTRAFNLIWALCKIGQLTPGKKLAVVGAGLGGITAALAALEKGCRVDLYEQASQPSPLHRGNGTRFIHPNILEWPRDGSENSETDFPFLNWAAANANGVIEQIDLQWKRAAAVHKGRLNEHFYYRVDELKILGLGDTDTSPSHPCLCANWVQSSPPPNDMGYIEERYDAILLAVGFGEERSVPNAPALPYWTNDDLHQEKIRASRTILVSGCGDGGLVDALRLRLRNFDHADFVRRFLTVSRSPTLITDLAKAENELQQHAIDANISSQLKVRYDKIDVPHEVIEYFQDAARTDTVVTLNSTQTGPLNFRASLLNRYATYLAIKHAGLLYRAGKIEVEKADGSYRVRFCREGFAPDHPEVFDSVVVRHGPDNVIGHLLPEKTVKALREQWSLLPDITTRPAWKEGTDVNRHRFFLEYQRGTALPQNETADLALLIFDSAYRKFMLDREVVSVAVGKHRSRMGLIVRLKEGAAPRSPIFYAGILRVQFATAPNDVARKAINLTLTNVLEAYKHLAEDLDVMSMRLPETGTVFRLEVQLKPTAAPRAPMLYQDVPIVFTPSIVSAPPSTTLRPEQENTGKRRVPVGAGIYNHSAQLRTNVPQLGLGTLGCFGVDQLRQRYLLSANSVLLPDAAAKPGDEIYLEGEAPGDYQPIAIVTSPATGREDAALPIAAALLAPDVLPIFAETYTGIPASSYGLAFSHVADARVDDAVAQFGWGSGPDASYGVVLPPDTRATRGEDAAPGQTGWINIRSEKQADFSLPSDEGAAVFRDDGTILGFIVGSRSGHDGSAGLTIACPARSVYAALGLELYPI